MHAERELLDGRGLPCGADRGAAPRCVRGACHQVRGKNGALLCQGVRRVATVGAGGPLVAGSPSGAGDLAAPRSVISRRAVEGIRGPEPHAFLASGSGGGA
jgi:hypothetical protein